VVRLIALVVARVPAQDGLRTEVTASGVVPLVLLVALVALMLVALGVLGPGRRLRRAAAVLLLPASLAWVLFNGTLEGAVLLTFSTDHGLTVSDLLGVVGVAVAVTMLLRR
jgi:hypothetical protein